MHSATVRYLLPDSRGRTQIDLGKFFVGGLTSELLATRRTEALLPLIEKDVM